MHQILKIAYAASPENGEDSFAMRTDGENACLCVTDGCGGLGSRRYPQLAGHTGAYIAARLAADAFAAWAEERIPVPVSGEESQALCRELEDDILHRLKRFADTHCRSENSRIAGSMQRLLPSTLCGLTVRKQEMCFWWAGDSRGYTLDEDGLHQHTSDHVRGGPDAFEVLYRDAPLSNFLCADKPGFIAQHSVCAQKPCMAFVATDGVYSHLPTPMEMEMLLLDTLKKADSFQKWEQSFMRCMERTAQDDATLLMIPVGFENFEQIKAVLLPRREYLKKQFITPVRRRRGDMAFARLKWLQYKPEYSRMEESHA